MSESAGAGSTIVSGASGQMQVVKEGQKVQVVQMQNGFHFNVVSNDFPFLDHIQTNIIFPKSNGCVFSEGQNIPK